MSRLRAYKRALAWAAALAVLLPATLWLATRTDVVSRPSGQVLGLVAGVGPAIVVLVELGLLVARDAPELRRARLFKKGRRRPA